MQDGQAPVDSELIYDLGMHSGEDTAFYLKKGFRVVAVEANPDLAEAARTRFADALAEGRLILVNMAIAEREGELEFFVNEQNSQWSSIHRQWGTRGQKGHRIVRIPATTLDRLMTRHGVPYYIKIDIEGADLTALKSLADCPGLPRYVSVEGGREPALRVFEALGYDRFAVVPQASVPGSELRRPSHEGRDVAHVFPPGSSGPFGRDIEGEWMDFAAILADRQNFVAQLQEITTRHKDQPARLEAEKRRLGLEWCDVHACRSA